MFSSLIGSSKEKQLEFTSEDAAAIFSKIQPRLQSKLASSSASIASTSSTTSDASFASANSFYITSSGKGVVTSDFIQSQVEKILSGSSSDVRRITLADISDKLDLDKSTVQSYVETTALKQSIYQSNGVYFTSSELDRIASSLKASITEQPYVLSVKFGISEEIDPTLVKRVTESVNHSTDWDDRILSLHGPQSETYLISEKKLLFAQEQLKEWILAQDEPFTLSSIAVSNNPSPLLSDSKLRQIVVKNFVPYFVEYKDADGKLANVSSGAVLSDSDIISLFAPSSNLSLSDFQFIPERYQKKLQQQYIDSLKSNGVIEPSEFTKTGVIDVPTFLTKSLGSADSYILLADNIVLPSYPVHIAQEIISTIQEQGWVDLREVVFVGFNSSASEGADRKTLYRKYILPKVLELIEEKQTPVTNVYSEADITNKLTKTKKSKSSSIDAIPLYILTVTLYNSVESVLSSKYVIPLAANEADKIRRNQEAIDDLVLSYQQKYERGEENEFTSDLISTLDQFNAATKLDNKRAVSFTQDSQFTSFVSALANAHVSLISASDLLRRLVSEFLPALKSTYEAHIAANATALIQNEFIDKLYPVLLSVRAIFDIEKTDFKTASSFYDDFFAGLEEDMILAKNLVSSEDPRSVSPEQMEHLVVEKIRSVGQEKQSILAKATSSAPSESKVEYSESEISKTAFSRWELIVSSIESQIRNIISNASDPVEKNDVLQLSFLVCIVVYDKLLYHGSLEHVVGALSVSPSATVKVTKFLEKRANVDDLRDILKKLKKNKPVDLALANKLAEFALGSFEGVEWNENKKDEEKPEEKPEVSEPVKKQPIVEEAEPVEVSEDKPVIEEAKSFREVDEEKPTIEEAESQEVSEEKPTVEEAEPVEVSDEPVIEKAEPVEVSEDKPVIEEAESQEVNEEKTGVEKAESQEVSEDKPTAEEAEPVEISEDKPVIEEAETFAESSQEVNKEKPTAEEAEPVEVSDEPVIEETEPVIKPNAPIGGEKPESTEKVDEQKEEPATQKVEHAAEESVLAEKESEPAVEVPIEEKVDDQIVLQFNSELQEGDLTTKKIDNDGTHAEITKTSADFSASEPDIKSSGISTIEPVSKPEIVAQESDTKEPESEAIVDQEEKTQTSNNVAEAKRDDPVIVDLVASSEQSSGPSGDDSIEITDVTPASKADGPEKTESTGNIEITNIEHSGTVKNDSDIEEIPAPTESIPVINNSTEESDLSPDSAAKDTTLSSVPADTELETVVQSSEKDDQTDELDEISANSDAASIVSNSSSKSSNAKKNKSKKNSGKSFKRKGRR